MQTPSKRQIRVLFVEDERAARDGYAAYLPRCGYEVRTAATGHEALTLAMGWVPNVVLLDLGLPDMDGWEVARRLKAAPQTTAVPIIALTGADLTHERVSAVRAGCDCHLAKPCAPTDVVQAIERWVRELT